MSPLRQAPAALVGQDTARRGEYLAEVLKVLYPPPCQAGAVRPAAGAPVLAEYLAVPDIRRPRLLVPAGSRRIAAAAVHRYAQPAARLTRLKRDLAALAVRTGATAALAGNRITVTGPETGTIGHYLRDALHRELSFSVHIGPARANRKPVLQLLDPRGNTIGFAKLGTNALTRRLVRLESAALSTLHGVRLAEVRAPRVLHAGGWRGIEVLVQEALPAWQAGRGGRRRAPIRLAAAMREVAWCLGVTEGPLCSSGYARTLRERLDLLDTQSGEGPDLARAAGRLLDRAGHTELAYGAWHGDWAPWNMAVTEAAILVWDWERFSTGVPVGFDAVHYELQVRLERGEPAEAAVHATLSRAARSLAPFGGCAPEVTALLYLVDLASRYLADRQAEAGARLGVLGNWLLPVLIRRVAEL